MKRLIASLTMAVVCIVMSVAVLSADSATETSNPLYPPAPEGYEGPWPSDGYVTTTSTDTCDTCGEDNGGPWKDPNQ